MQCLVIRIVQSSIPISARPVFFRWLQSLPASCLTCRQEGLMFHCLQVVFFCHAFGLSFQCDCRLLQALPDQQMAHLNTQRRYYWLAFLISHSLPQIETQEILDSFSFVPDQSKVMKCVPLAKLGECWADTEHLRNRHYKMTRCSNGKKKLFGICNQVGCISSRKCVLKITQPSV